MNPKVRILSFHYIPNNGAFLFAYSLQNLLKEWCSDDTRLLDYREPKLALYEYLKRYKVFQKNPFFYLKRSRLWEKEIRTHLDLDRSFSVFANRKSLEKYFSQQYQVLVVGMDVWCVTNKKDRPAFPNIYWLPGQTDIRKVAYSVSAYNSDAQVIGNMHADIRRNLNGFDVIGVRDEYTFRLVNKYRDRKDGLVAKIPDPTFAYQIRRTKVGEKLIELGIDISRPVLGLLLFGEKGLSVSIHSHFKQRGYQIVSLSMYNSVADINLGHLLTPFEWAEVFQYFSFCITDRFHGTVFSLKNGTPFCAIEKDHHLPRDQSKIYDLLVEFGLERCYQNPANPDFSERDFFSRIEEIENSWTDEIKKNIQIKIDAQKNEHVAFIKKVRMFI